MERSIHLQCVLAYRYLVVTGRVRKASSIVGNWHSMVCVSRSNHWCVMGVAVAKPDNGIVFASGLGPFPNLFL
jgi:fatty acid-binding protein DegV